jgi:hypothetical protein
MRGLSVLAFLLAGCSTAPIADLMDHFAPGHVEPGKAAPYGGVCQPQQLVPPGPPPVLPGPPPAGTGIVPGSPSIPPGPQAVPLPPPDFGLPPAPGPS